jgi:hypothetical protein
VTVDTEQDKKMKPQGGFGQIVRGSSLPVRRGKGGKSKTKKIVERLEQKLIDGNQVEMLGPVKEVHLGESKTANYKINRMCYRPRAEAHLDRMKIIL